MVDAAALALSVHHFLDRQKDSLFKEVFERFKEESSGTIRTDVLQQALFEFGVPVPKKTAEELMLAMDLDENGGLDYEEFKRAVAQPPTQLEQWASMLPLAGMLASSLPISGGQGDQPLRDFSRLGEDEIKAAVEAFRGGLTQLLLEAKTKLTHMFEVADKKASKAAQDSADGCSTVSKFKTFKMSTGTISDYHGGLSSRIGNSPPSKWLSCICIYLHYDDG
jgi:hypothetical protein